MSDTNNTNNNNSKNENEIILFLKRHSTFILYSSIC